VWLLFSVTLVHAAVHDSDGDGLTDESELETYHTDPLKPDTDGDTVSDGQEIIDGTDPLDSGDSQLQRFQNELHAPALRSESLAWYIGRASGIFAFMLLTLVVVNGLLISTRLVARFMPPALNFEMHQFFAWMALITTGVHIASFTFDPFIRLRWSQALIPFALKGSLVSALGYNLKIPVTLGVFALYGILTLLLTSYFRNKIGIKTWRRIHYVSFATYCLFLFHGISAGTDSTQWWMEFVYSFSALLVGILVIVRIRQSLRKPPIVQQPRQERDPFAGLNRSRPDVHNDKARNI